MKIDGKLIARQILEDLKKTIKSYKLSPTLLVILVGESPQSLSFVRQKEKAARFIDANLIIKNLPENISSQNFLKLIGESNKDTKIDGVIVQLPLPNHLDPGRILRHIAPEKDVDGFTPKSQFTPPVVAAVFKILGSIPGINISKRIMVIGRGLTAGKPIAEALKKQGFKISIAHSKTRDLGGLVKKVDVVISCVGKPEIVKAEVLKAGAIVIGIGIHREPSGKLAGDFDENDVSRVASFYTPTPGGIGPINVACLMENLTRAAKIKKAFQKDCSAMERR